MNCSRILLNDHSKSQPRLQSCRWAGRTVNPPKSSLARLRPRLRWISAIIALFASAAGAAPASTTDGPNCQTVRFADVGWTDVTSTTALASQVLRSIGYSPAITVLSVPVTFASLQNKDIDVFLGNWMPTQKADIGRYLEDGSVTVVGANLEGAKYTLAVPTYTFAAGLREFKDIQRFAPALNNSIYGIEPGNDGNRLVLKMLQENLFNLGGFKLVESSEQGMLAQVERAVRGQQPVVFLAWEPHPMNMRFDLKYLSGGDEVFGPNYGGATIYTVTRKGYADACPNVGRLLNNLKFTLRGESEMMAAILDRHEPPDVAATEWLRANPGVMNTWLDGVLTFDGRPALTALSHSAVLPRTSGFEQWVTSHKIPVGDFMAVAIDYVKAHGTYLFDGISIVIRGMVDAVNAALRALPAPALIVAAAHTRVGTAPLVAARRLCWRGSVVYFESGLLGSHPGDPCTGRGGDCSLRHDRHSFGDCSGASTPALRCASSRP